MRTFLWYAAPVLLSAYPVAIVLGANLGVVPLSASVVARSLATATVSAAVLLFLLRFVQRDLATRAAFLSWLLFCLTLYSSALLFAGQLGVDIDPGNPLFAATYVALSLVVALAAARPWKVQQREPLPFVLVALALLLVAVAPGAVLLARATEARPAAPAAKGPAWQGAADALVASTLNEPVSAALAERPDIYYVVLDGFGSADTLRTHYNLDLREFVAGLEAQGFYVPDRARTNYAQTFLSLGSALNMTYLDPLAAALGPAAQDRRPLSYLIQENALMKMASRAGYRVIAVGSNHMSTERFALADECVCAQFGLHEIELAAIALTPLAALPVDRWRADAYEAHRRKVRESLAAIANAASAPGPKFVFAHMLVPHPPFVFEPDGGPRPQPTPAAFRFQDGNHFRGTTEEYVSGYRDQAAFLARELTRLADALIRRSGDRKPVIVIHGDHGPGSRLIWEDPDATDMGERLGIFAAYHVPGGSARLHPAMTPVNGTRMVASYFGVDLPPLPDDSYFSRWTRPYDFIRVPPGR